MVDDPLSYILTEIQKVLCPGSTIQDPSGVIKLIDKVISFPTNRNTWKYHFKKEPSAVLEQLSTSEGKKELICQLKHLIFPVETLRIDRKYATLSFNKQQITKFIFYKILESKSFGRNIRICKNRVEIAPIQGCDLENLSDYRVMLVQKCLRNVLQLIEFPDESDTIVVSVTGPNTSNTCCVKCGLVVEPKIKKVCELKSSEYKELRSTDMKLIAMHKYGLRINDDAKFNEMIRKLGLAAVSVDLLEVKHSSPVQINRAGQGCTKGASFILYNFARLETLLRGFDAGIKCGKYSQLPDLENVDLELLNEEEEWQLIFTYIFTFSNMIKRCVSDLDRGSFQLHIIIQYINGLVSTFSIYYRRTRILLQNREHLIPVIHARIFLLKCLQYILKLSLKTLNIDPVQYM